MSQNVCPTCQRPWQQLQPHQRARRGHQGTEHEAAALVPAEQLTRACRSVLAELLWQARWGRDGGWVSARRLRDVLDGGDGPRRARQLRDEYGWPVESEMRSGPTQAWYRLTHIPEDGAT